MHLLRPTVEQLKLLEKTAITLAKLAAKPRKSTSKKAAPKISEKGRRAITFAKAHFSDAHLKGLAHIIGALSEDSPSDLLELVKPEGKVVKEIPGFFGTAFARGAHEDWAPGAAIVPLTQRNSHSYKLNSVCFSPFDRKISRHVLVYFGEKDCYPHTGNHMDFNPNAWRPATVAEIQAEIKRVLDYYRKNKKQLNNEMKLPF